MLGSCQIPQSPQDNTMTKGKRRTPGRQKNEYPNFPEVSGTTLPLLATVLAGFAVTIILQILLSPDASGDIPRITLVALIAFLLSLLAFLSSTAFAVNAQANNYLPFIDMTDTGKKFLGVDQTDTWLERIERRWHIYHMAGLIACYSGVVLLLAGVNLILWEYAGVVIASVFLVATLASLAVNLLLARLAADNPDSI